MLLWFTSVNIEIGMDEPSVMWCRRLLPPAVLHLRHNIDAAKSLTQRLLCPAMMCIHVQRQRDEGHDAFGIVMRIGALAVVAKLSSSSARFVSQD